MYYVLKMSGSIFCRYKPQHIFENTAIITIPKKPKRKRIQRLWQKIEHTHSKVILPDNITQNELFLPSKLVFDKSEYIAHACAYISVKILADNQKILHFAKVCLVDFSGRYIPLCRVMMKFCGAVLVYTSDMSRKIYDDEQNRFFEKYGAMPVILTHLPNKCKIISAPDSGIITVGSDKYSVNEYSVPSVICNSGLSKNQTALLSLAQNFDYDNYTLFCGENECKLSQIRL